MTTPGETAKRPRRRRLRFSLRTLLVAVSIACALLALWVVPAERQRHAVAAVRAAKGWVEYDRELPEWLRTSSAVHYFAKAEGVRFYKSALDDDLLTLRGLTTVLHVSLEHCAQVGDAGLKHLVAIPQLKALDLSGSAITNDGLKHLRGLPNLEFLSVQWTQVNDNGLRHIGAMTQLEGVHLAGTQVTGTGFSHLRGLKRLEYLALYETPVDDSGLAHLGALTSLRSLFELLGKFRTVELLNSN